MNFIATKPFDPIAKEYDQWFNCNRSIKIIIYGESNLS